MNTEALSEFLTLVPECLQVGFVDLKSGMLLEIRTIEGQSQDLIERAAAATVDLFAGENVAKLERQLEKYRPGREHSGHQSQEFVVASRDVVHIFERSKKDEDTVFVAVCGQSPDIRILLAKARAAFAAVDAATAAPSKVKG